MQGILTIAICIYNSFKTVSILLIITEYENFPAISFALDENREYLSLSENIHEIFYSRALISMGSTLYPFIQSSTS